MGRDKIDRQKRRGLARSGLRDKLARLFTERQIFYRRRGQVSFVSFSRRVQIAAVIVLVTFGAWVAYSSIYVFTVQGVLREKNRQIAEARLAYRTAMRDVAGYNSRLIAITRNLERSQTQILMRINTAVNGKLNGTRQLARFAALDRALASASHRVMTRRIRELESEWRNLVSRNTTLKFGLASIGSEVENILSENGVITAERDQLRGRVRGLEGRVARLRLRQDQVANALAQHDAVTAERNRLRNQVLGLQGRLAGLRSRQDVFLTRLTRRTKQTLDEATRVIALTGLNLDSLIAAAAAAEGKTLAKGGPFVGIAQDDDPLRLKVAVLDAQTERWQYMRKVFRRLPLSAPLEHYRLSSRYGMRRDPKNRRWSMHRGMDLANPYNTPVLVTAQGRVVFAGWRGGLGWLIEIDHGLGVRTRYAHLRKILVKKGDRVEYRHKIGLVGSSGRSTGPHVHYEILVKGKPVDPMKFIKAGKYVFKG